MKKKYWSLLMVPLGMVIFPGCTDTNTPTNIMNLAYKYLREENLFQFRSLLDEQAKETFAEDKKFLEVISKLKGLKLDLNEPLLIDRKPIPTINGEILETRTYDVDVVTQTSERAPLVRSTVKCTAWISRCSIPGIDGGSSTFPCWKTYGCKIFSFVEY